MNNRKIKATVIVGFLLLSIALAAESVAASVPTPTPAKHCTLKVIDSTRTETIEFTLGDTIGLSWTADGPTDIVVTNDATNGIVHQVLNAPAVGSDTFTATAAGDYTVTVYGHGTLHMIDLDTYFVTPESAFGALALMGAGFAAVGTIAIVKRKKA